jgi:hypothetical protein
MAPPFTIFFGEGTATQTTPALLFVTPDDAHYVVRDVLLNNADPNPAYVTLRAGPAPYKIWWVTQLDSYLSEHLDLRQALRAGETLELVSGGQFAHARVTGYKLNLL